MRIKFQMRKRYAIDTKAFEKGSRRSKEAQEALNEPKRRCSRSITNAVKKKSDEQYRNKYAKIR